MSKQKYKVVYPHGKKRCPQTPVRERPKPSSSAVFPYLILAALMACGICLVQRAFLPDPDTAYTPDQVEIIGRLVQAEPSAQPSIDDILDAVETVESHGDCSAISRKGARGCYQVMPGTARRPGLGVRPMHGHSYREERRFARQYLLALHARYRDWRKAVAAYNGGIARIDSGDWPDETVEYVIKVERELARS